MALAPTASLGMSLATLAVVQAIYSNATSPLNDIRSLDKNNTDVNASERAATWLAAGVVGGISLLAKDPTIFTIGGIGVIAMAWMHRHADQVDNVTNSATGYATKLADVGNTNAGLTTTPTQSTGVLNLGTSVI